MLHTGTHAQRSQSSAAHSSSSRCSSSFVQWVFLMSTVLKVLDVESLGKLRKPEFIFVIFFLFNRILKLLNYLLINLHIYIFYKKLTTYQKDKWLLFRKMWSFSKHVNMNLKDTYPWLFVNPCFCTHYVWWMHNFGSKYKESQLGHKYVLGRGKELTQHWKDLVRSYGRLRVLNYTEISQLTLFNYFHSIS